MQLHEQRKRNRRWLKYSYLTQVQVSVEKDKRHVVPANALLKEWNSLSFVSLQLNKNPVTPWEFEVTIFSKALAKRYSQLKPTRAKVQNQNCIAGWPNDTTKSSQLARNHSVVWIRPRSHITIKKKLARVGSNWLRWPNDENCASSWAKIWAWSSSQLDPTRAKWVAKRYPTPSKLCTWLELVWVGRPGLNPFAPRSDQFHISPTASPEMLHHTVWRTWLFIA